MFKRMGMMMKKWETLLVSRRRDAVGHTVPQRVGKYASSVFRCTGMKAIAAEVKQIYDQAANR